MDLKYLSAERAKKYSGAGDYPDVVKKALMECYRQKPVCVIDDNGIMKSGLIVRHLILPQGTKEAMNCFEWVKNNLRNACFSMMSQYVPYYQAERFAELNRKITKREYEKVINYILSSDFDNVFLQERSSADQSFIPDFSAEKNKILCKQ